MLSDKELDVTTRTAQIRGMVRGEGPAVVLIHGFPETHFAWHRIWNELSKDFTVIACDLRGYGDSLCLDGDMTFRAMGNDIADVMNYIGEERFHVVGHDRGARVAHRIAIDHTRNVISNTLLDILPTASVWKRMDANLARAYWHWSFLAQPKGTAERLIAADPTGFLHAWLGVGGSDAISAEALGKYETAASRPSVQEAFCADYRAEAGEDLKIDAQDTARPLMPTLLHWGTKSIVGDTCDPMEEWRSIFPNVTGGPLPGGHFIPEESPVALLESLHKFLLKNSSS